jgi:ankyrin repeat protein
MKKFPAILIFTYLVVVGYQSSAQTGSTTLINALRHKDKESVKLALDNGESPNQRNEYGIPAITLALDFNDISIITYFIKYKVNLNIEDNNGLTPLIVSSAIYNQKDICKLLIKNGADINKKAKNGFTSLMLAAQNNFPEMVWLLLDNGASIDIDRPQGGTALGFAADKGNLDVVKILLDHGANINFKDSAGGYTPLMIAVFMKRYETVKYLLEKGADRNIKAKDGNTAIDFARQLKDRRLNEILDI